MQYETTFNSQNIVPRTYSKYTDIRMHTNEYLNKWEKCNTIKSAPEISML